MLRRLFLASAVVLSPSPLLRALDTVTRIDDEKVVGTVTGIDSNGSITVQATAGGVPRTATIPAVEVLSVRFGHETPAGEKAKGDLIVLASGERYRVKLGSEPVGALPGFTSTGADALGGSNSVAFANLRAYVPEKDKVSTEEAARTLQELLVLENDRDVVMMVNGDRLTGVVEKLAPGEVVVSAKVGRVPVKWDGIRGIAFSKTLKPYTEPESLLAEVLLSDGSLVRGTLSGPAGGTYALRSVLGYSWDVRPDRIREVRFRGGKLVWLSDLKPANVVITPFFNRSWPYREDRSVWGAPLTVGGTVYERGIGCHSRTELTYDIDGQYVAFIADIGIDDETKGVGSALFSVIGGGKPLLDRVEASAGKSPQRVNVNVTGVKQLKLLVDFGKNQDAGDHADWLNARLIRK
jgi:hypothetical protein